MDTTRINRRAMLSMTACAGAGLALLGRPSFLAAASSAAEKKGEEAATPVEHFSKDHGDALRFLLIWEEACRRLDKGGKEAVKALHESAQAVQMAVGEAHERLEEMHVFPKFQGSGEMAELVKILNRQHDAGRAATKRIIELTKGDLDDAKRGEVKNLVASFGRMYRPHIAFEQDELFPAFRGILSKGEYEELGKQFSEQEKEILGQDGAKKIKSTMEDLEKALGLHDLDTFTMRA